VTATRTEIVDTVVLGCEHLPHAESYVAALGASRIGRLVGVHDEAPALGHEGGDPLLHLRPEAQRDPADQLLGGVEVVGQDDLVELGDEPGRAATSDHHHHRGHKGGLAS